MRIIGITGQPSSGKDTIAEYLVGKGFVNISGGDILRQEMTKLGIPTDRSQLTEFSAGQRSKYGNGYLAQQAIKRVRGDTVMSGIRNTEEVRVLREKFGRDFFLLAVDVPIEKRYQRAVERGRIGDDISFERFKAEEQAERAAASGSHEVDKVIAMADAVILNDGTREDLFAKVQEVLSKL